MKKILFLVLFMTTLFSYDKNYSYRKYIHVKTFYKSLVEDVVKLGVKYNVPPAAILSIASLESGYGRGYISAISGNILSLGAFKEDFALPSVYLPHLKKTGRVIYNRKEMKKYKKDELIWSQRVDSLKRDYRPVGIAGTSNNLDFFDYQKELKREANLKNVEDFCTRWIIEGNRYQTFKDARANLDAKVKKYGKDILFSEELNIEFIKSIGGKPNSFNQYKSWVVKVLDVMKKTGLVKLTFDTYKGKEFDEAW